MRGIMGSTRISTGSWVLHQALGPGELLLRPGFGLLGPEPQLRGLGTRGVAGDLEFVDLGAETLGQHTLLLELRRKELRAQLRLGEVGRVEGLSLGLLGLGQLHQGKGLKLRGLLGTDENVELGALRRGHELRVDADLELLFLGAKARKGRPPPRKATQHFDVGELERNGVVQLGVLDGRRPRGG
jgi:hypothetical protein